MIACEIARARQKFGCTDDLTLVVGHATFRPFYALHEGQLNGHPDRDPRTPADLVETIKAKYTTRALAP
jgi:hypothetical protein